MCELECVSKVLEVNADKTKYVVIARDYHAGQNNYMDMGNNVLRGWKNLNV